MAIVHFYEKPGCFYNTRQKQLLISAGHLLVVHDLLHYPWAENKQRLRCFFADCPVAEWFNRNAPALKNGEIHPELLTEQDAIELMVADPILIRRPLLEVAGHRRAGFDSEHIEQWIGLAAVKPALDLETCNKPPNAKACQP